jgi:hypothetical protein
MIAVMSFPRQFKNNVSIEDGRKKLNLPPVYFVVVKPLRGIPRSLEACNFFKHSTTIWDCMEPMWRRALLVNISVALEESCKGQFCEGVLHSMA